MVYITVYPTNSVHTFSDTKIETVTSIYIHNTKYIHFNYLLHCCLYDEWLLYLLFPIYFSIYLYIHIYNKFSRFSLKKKCERTFYPKQKNLYELYIIYEQSKTHSIDSSYSSCKRALVANGCKNKKI